MEIGDSVEFNRNSDFAGACAFLRKHFKITTQATPYYQKFFRGTIWRIDGETK